jgi:hypothetical protein
MKSKVLTNVHSQGEQKKVQFLYKIKSNGSYVEELIFLGCCATSVGSCLPNKLSTNVV